MLRKDKLLGGVLGLAIGDRERSGSLPKEATGKSNRTQVSYLRL